MDEPHDTLFHSQGFWHAPAAILAALESAVRAEYLWLAADASRTPGFGFMQGSALRSLSQLIPQIVNNALPRLAEGLASPQGISHTDKTSTGNSNTGRSPLPSQQETTNLEYPDPVKVTAALASLLLSCLKVTGARHTSSPPQVTAAEMPIRAILSCMVVAATVPATNKEFISQ